MFLKVKVASKPEQARSFAIAVSEADRNILPKAYHSAISMSNEIKTPQAFVCKGVTDKTMLFLHSGEGKY
jgi:hypothetical protein